MKDEKMKKNKYQAVVFDLDGTLADSIADIAGSMNKALSHFGFPVHSYEEYKHLVGNGLKNLALVSLPEDSRGEETVERCFRFLMDDYSANYLNNTKLYDGMTQLLDALSRQGMKLAVLSNKADKVTSLICKVLLSDWKFEMILGATDRFPRKPAPDSALYIAGEIGVEPRQILYLGDTGIDMQTANAAGMMPVGVTWGFRTEKELRDNGARAIIHHPMELLDVAMD